jgi:outer membrane protein assembly factor BamB
MPGRLLISTLASQFSYSACAGRVISWLAVPLTVAFALFGVTAITFAQSTPNPLLGTWVGALNHEGEFQQLALRFELDEKQSLVTYFYQPEMKFYNLGPGPVEQRGKGYEAPPLTFQLSPDKKTIVGAMSFDGNNLTFELARGTAPDPPAPKRADGRVAQPLWIFKTGAAIWSSPAVDEGRVYFGSNDGFVYSLKADSGVLAWQFKTGGWVVGRPTLNGEYLYVLSDDGLLYKLHKRTGKAAWKFDTHGGSVKRIEYNPPEAVDFDVLTSAPTVVDGTVYVGSADRNLYALDANTGAEKWHFTTQDLVRSTPAVADNIVVVGSRDHHVYAVDSKTGALRWKHDTLREVVSSPLVLNDTAYIGSRDSNLYAFDVPTGKIKWRLFYWTSFVESSARAWDGILYIGSSDYQRLLAIDAANGKRLWMFDVGGSAWSTPAVSDKLVYIGAVGEPNSDYIVRNGGFFAVARSTGKLAWRYPMSPIAGSRNYGVASSPAVGHGLVFFGGIDGTFYAFREAP